MNYIITHFGVIKTHPPTNDSAFSTLSILNILNRKDNRQTFNFGLKNIKKHEEGQGNFFENYWANEQFEE